MKKTNNGNQNNNGHHIIIASDHAGFELKSAIVAHFTNYGLNPLDCGAYSEYPVDYADYAESLALKMQELLTAKKATERGVATREASARGASEQATPATSAAPTEQGGNSSKNFENHRRSRLKGILICGSGVGISIKANRYPHIRAALCFNKEMASLARKHNDANVLCLGARFLTTNQALEMVREFLITDFEGGRHKKRVAKL